METAGIADEAQVIVAEAREAEDLEIAAAPGVSHLRWGQTLACRSQGFLACVRMTG